MASRRQLGPDDVKRMALAGRVRPSHKYHATVHAVKYEELHDHLVFCGRVVIDSRTDKDGNLRHPQGYVAWCQDWGGEVYRVDFDLETDADGDIICIVTGLKLEK